MEFAAIYLQRRRHRAEPDASASPVAGLGPAVVGQGLGGDPRGKYLGRLARVEVNDPYPDLGPFAGERLDEPRDAPLAGEKGRPGRTFEVAEAPPSPSRRRGDAPAGSRGRVEIGARGAGQEEQALRLGPDAVRPYSGVEPCRCSVAQRESVDDARDRPVLADLGKCRLDRRLRREVDALRVQDLDRVPFLSKCLSQCEGGAAAVVGDHDNPAGPQAGPIGGQGGGGDFEDRPADGRGALPLKGRGCAPSPQASRRVGFPGLEDRFDSLDFDLAESPCSRQHVHDGRGRTSTSRPSTDSRSVPSISMQLIESMPESRPPDRGPSA